MGGEWGDFNGLGWSCGNFTNGFLLPQSYKPGLGVDDSMFQSFDDWDQLLYLQPALPVEC